MLSLLLVIVLAWSFYIGYNRGLILQIFYSLISILALVIAAANFKSLAPKLTLWLPYANPTQNSSVAFFKGVNLFDLDQVYYAGAAFLAIYVLTYLLGRLLGIFVHLAPIDRLIGKPYAISSGFLALLVTAISLGLFLSVLASLPITSLQTHLSASFLGRLLISSTSFISNLWLG